MGEAIKFGRGKLVTLDPVFANNDWDKIISACQRKAVPDTWKVGDQKPMTINGADYVIDIIGKNHDDYADGGGKAPLTFQTHDSYTTDFMYGDFYNKYGWIDSHMRKDIMPFIEKQLPSEVQSALREVNKNTNAGGGYTTIKTTADKLFLFSEIEVFGTNTYTPTGEGSRYEYFDSSAKRVKKLNNAAQAWWTRSPYSPSGTDYVIVNSTGASTTLGAPYTAAVAFAFCF